MYWTDRGTIATTAAVAAAVATDADKGEGEGGDVKTARWKLRHEDGMHKAVKQRRQKW